MSAQRPAKFLVFATDSRYFILIRILLLLYLPPTFQAQLVEPYNVIYPSHCTAGLQVFKWRNLSLIGTIQEVLGVLAMERKGHYKQPRHNWRRYWIHVITLYARSSTYWVQYQPLEPFEQSYIGFFPQCWLGSCGKKSYSCGLRTSAMVHQTFWTGVGMKLLMLSRYRIQYLAHIRQHHRSPPSGVDHHYLWLQNASRHCAELSDRQACHRSSMTLFAIISMAFL